MSSDCLSLGEALKQLDEVAPEAPFLALGQTVFWDEPMKGGFAQAARRLGSTRRFIAGIHDTDYFAKLAAGAHQPGRFKTFPHNDTGTRGLWSAAGEFSALFGSETVITRETLLMAGSRLSAVQKARPTILDEATEAWGWRGIVSLDEHAPITADVPLHQIIKELCGTLDWALNTSLDCLAGGNRPAAEALTDELHARVCEHADERSMSVGEFYQKVARDVYDFSANSTVDLETTRTSELLRFNASTCGRPRFGLLERFVNPATRAEAAAAYDKAIAGTSMYELSKFGTGAIPFDLVIPGLGRGTIRLGTRGAVIATDKPQFLSFKKPPTSLEDLARAVEEKFGPDCAIVGKAVTLIGMLAKEFVFVFHEGASSYVSSSHRLHELLGHQVNPILRIRYDAWSAMSVCCSWLRLPRPLQRPFGVEEICAPSFASRWRSVAEEQEKLLEQLGRLRRPVELIGFLDRHVGGSWNSIAGDYERLHGRLAALEKDVEEIRKERHRCYALRRELSQARTEAERRKGEHFRARIFEKEPNEGDLAERERLTHEIEEILHARTELQNQMHQLRKRQNELVKDPEIQKVHERRRGIELEAELMRLTLIREAVIASRGLQAANRRPSAWWFRLVCPDGLWFRETVDTAGYYLERL
ncbi:MAG TPA: hypothetical protein VK934_04125 [Fimbriimonas sp.]|nr:hypothetical protein [Fimbriimonas sp.]